MLIELFPHQLEALQRMRNGCILSGGVGSGKSLTSLSYYYLQNGGSLEYLKGRTKYVRMKEPRDLYIITTAQKRDKMEWDGEMLPFYISRHEDCNLYKNKVIIDSWNNIKKYSNVYGAFFIFDEQRVVGSGVWVKSFLKIAKKNKWILLSATPGDTWKDYIPVFVANGFYRNKTEFDDEHTIYARFSKFPMIEGYKNTGKLMRHRASILIPMEFSRTTVQHHNTINTDYDKILYKDIMKRRWNPFLDKPVINASQLCYILRRVVNEDKSRIEVVKEIYKKHKRLIIFYNFDYELNILKNINYGRDVVVAEWNGHAHDDVPTSDNWVYLVQYTAGSEGWNCITTDATLFYSQNYSYKIMIQSAGRIDRLNTKFTDLYYYHLKSKSDIDLAIGKALASKKKFNASAYIKW